MVKNSSFSGNFGFDPRFPLVENEPLARMKIVSGFLFAHNFHTTLFHCSNQLVYFEQNRCSNFFKFRKISPVQWVFPLYNFHRFLCIISAEQ